MSDTAPRNATAATQRLANALLRTTGGTQALLRVTGGQTSSTATEIGLTATTFAEVPISPASMRKLRPTWKEGEAATWELLLSATSVAQQVNTLQLDSAEALFAMTLGVSVAGRDYLIEGISSNEAFGSAYLYRLLLREARPQGV